MPYIDTTACETTIDTSNTTTSSKSFLTSSLNITLKDTSLKGTN